ncbi:hypothetical protein D3C87_1397850 [compost metagenome]
MSARRRDTEIAAPEHQRGTVLIGFGGGVQPVAVGRPFDVRCPGQRQAYLSWAIGTDSQVVHIGRFIYESIVEADLLQRGDHFVIAASQRLSLQVVEAFAQLPEQLLKASEKPFALGVHLLALLLFELVDGDEITAGHHHRRAQDSSQHRQKPGAKEPTTECLASSRHCGISDELPMSYSC